MNYYRNILGAGEFPDTAVYIGEWHNKGMDSSLLGFEVLVSNTFAEDFQR